MNLVPNLPDAYYMSNFFEQTPKSILLPEELVKQCCHLVEKQFYETRMFRPAGCPGPMVMSFNVEKNKDGNFVDSDYSESIQQVFEPIISHLQNNLHVFSKRPFQLSINIYNDAQHSLAPHRDSHGICTCIISLQSFIMLDFYKHPKENPYGLLVGEIDYGRAPTQSILLEPNSLFVFSKESFQQYLHGVQQKQKDEFYRNEQNEWYTWNSISKEMSLRNEQDEQYHSPVCNVELLSQETRKQMEELKMTPRGKRIAILIWSEEC